MASMWSIGLQQGSSTSPFLFMMIMDVLAYGNRAYRSIYVAHDVCRLHRIAYHQKRGGQKQTRRVDTIYGREELEDQQKEDSVL